MTATHFTAWLVNDPSALDADACDVTVIEDELIGGDPEDDGDWSSHGEEQFRAVTTVDARDGDIQDAIKEAEALLAAAGWSIVGEWDSADNAYTVTVERD
jgi:hypothetical protein